MLTKLPLKAKQYSRKECKYISNQLPVSPEEVAEYIRADQNSTKSEQYLLKIMILGVVRDVENYTGIALRTQDGFLHSTNALGKILNFL